MPSLLNLLAAGLAVALLVGGYLTGKSDATNACRADQADERRTRAEAHARELLGQINRADRVAIAAARRDSELTGKLQETEHALKNATTDRPCLGGAALRVLDHATGLRPPPAGAAEGRPAAAAADPQDEEEVATDTDVAGWIAVAGDYYERCRARIRDIRCIDDGGCE